jgi:cell fate regulator YaaT (PSP1 superfamily)
LTNIDLPGGQQAYDILEVRFKNSRKDFFRNSQKINIQTGDVVVVDAASGFDVGVVSIFGELARIQVRKKKKDFKPLEARKVLRIADQKDIDLWIKARSHEKELMFKARTLALNIGLEMKISDVEYQGDMSKAIFYYTAEGRVDFRQLIKDMASEFRMRIEMKQIGSRQESARLGGIGSCGRELCCSSWLTDFRSVSTSAARYQQLSLNPQKLAGQCGKLKCCLNFELDAYLEGLKSFPRTDVRLKTKKGDAYHVKTDVFKGTMWYAFRGENELYPLSSSRVKEIIETNKKGNKPSDLQEHQINETAVIEDPGYTNVVGQDSVSRFEKTFKQKKLRKKNIPNKKK